MASQAQAVGSAPFVSWWELADLPESVQNTITQARAPTMRPLYALKWSVFTPWCSTRGTDTVFCDIVLIFFFLQELLDKRRSPSLVKVFVAAIAASHATGGSWWRRLGHVPGEFSWRQRVHGCSIKLYQVPVYCFAHLICFALFILLHILLFISLLFFFLPIFIYMLLCCVNFI